MTEKNFVAGATIAQAWTEAVKLILRNTGTEVSPMVLTVQNESGDVVVPEFEAKLDKLLLSRRKRCVANVAFTIFPQILWKVASPCRQDLYRLYKYSFPFYRTRNKSLNRNGLYFQRMIDFHPEEPDSLNQLEYIIGQYTGRKDVRRSMLQASVFDATRDHKPDAQLGFPCLQHVTFSPGKSTLTVNAFYATQQLFNRGYGNYLGLWNLGEFMASQMGLKMNRLITYVGIAKLENIGKTDSGLLDLITCSEAGLQAHA